MKIEFVALFARIIVINSVALIASAVVLVQSNQSVEIPMTYVVLLAVYNLFAFLYPIGILRKRIRENSYAFLKSWWHYVAICITVLYWTAILLRMMSL